MPLNADLRQRVVIDSGRLEWQEDPATGLRLKPLAHATDSHRTDIREYPSGTRIEETTHADAEILVLSGCLEDVSGDYPAGSYLLLPRGQPLASTKACSLFIKRGQAGMRLRTLRPQERTWHPGLVPGLRVLSLGEFETSHTALVEWAPNTFFQQHRHYGGEEIFVMSGVFQDEFGDYPAGTWLRSPHMSTHVPFSESGCLIFVKVGHLPME